MPFARFRPAFLAAAAALVSIPAAAQIRLYEHADFRGRSIETDTQIRDLERRGFNDAASSAVVSGGRWLVCTDAGFGGSCTTLRPGRYRNFEPMGINDQISSIRRVGRR